MYHLIQLPESQRMSNGKKKRERMDRKKGFDSENPVFRITQFFRMLQKVPLT